MPLKRTIPMLKPKAKLSIEPSTGPRGVYISAAEKTRIMGPSNVAFERGRLFVP